MTDTIIANLPASALRSILRSLLGVDPKVTPVFNALASSYLDTTKPTSTPKFWSRDVGITEAFDEWQSRYRCLMGVGRGFESLEVLGIVVEQFRELGSEVGGGEENEVTAGIDSDIVQAVTAVQKEIRSPKGFREMTESEIKVLEKLRASLSAAEKQTKDNGLDFPFQRANGSVDMLFQPSQPRIQKTGPKDSKYRWKESSLKSTQLGTATVPRIFMGLWQFSSPAWGTASKAKIEEGFRKHVDRGFVAYGMF